MKTMVAVVCVAAAGMGGFKAYNAANQSEADMLLAENVEALSSGDNGNYDEWEAYKTIVCPWQTNRPSCNINVTWHGETRTLYRAGYYLDTSRLPW